MRTRRLTSADRTEARALFALMADVFGEASESLSDAYLDQLLNRPDFFAMAAYAGDAITGGITAHRLPMTRAAESELFVYDVAVRADQQRKGVGRALIAALRLEAAREGIDDVFVLVDNEDEHALDFYRAVGGAASPVTAFTFSRTADTV